MRFSKPPLFLTESEVWKKIRNSKAITIGFTMFFDGVILLLYKFLNHGDLKGLKRLLKRYITTL